MADAPPDSNAWAEPIAATGARAVPSGVGLLPDARREPQLSAAEEADLARRCQAGDSAAAEALVRSQLRRVVAWAQVYRGLGAPMGDLVQEGIIGLLKAVQRYDPERETRLGTYASSWIRNAMQEHAVRYAGIVRTGTSSAHRALFLRLKKMRAAVEDSVAALIDACDPMSEGLAGNLAQRFNLSVAEVRATAARALAGDRSLEAPTGEPDSDGTAATPPRERLASEASDPETQVSEQSRLAQVQNLVERLLAALPDREALVIRRRYLESEAARTFDQIGHELGVSKDRARQLESQAIRRLRAALPSGTAVGDLLAPAGGGASPA